ncbi:MAG: DUF4190 domain-containing protein [Candidatus Saccharimonas sp.]
MNPDNQTPQGPEDAQQLVVQATPGTVVPPQDISAPRAGKGMGLAGLILGAFGFITFGVTAVVGLILSAVARSRASKAGHPSGLALSGIIVSIVGICVGAVLFVAVMVTLGSQLIDKCNTLGVGAHSNVTVIGVNGTLTCDANGPKNFTE